MSRYLGNIAPYIVPVTSEPYEKVKRIVVDKPSVGIRWGDTANFEIIDDRLDHLGGGRSILTNPGIGGGLVVIRAERERHEINVMKLSEVYRQGARGRILAHYSPGNLHNNVYVTLEETHFTIMPDSSFEIQDKFLTDVMRQVDVYYVFNYGNTNINFVDYSIVRRGEHPSAG